MGGRCDATQPAPPAGLEEEDDGWVLQFLWCPARVPLPRGRACVPTTSSCLAADALRPARCSAAGRQGKEAAACRRGRRDGRIELECGPDLKFGCSGLRN